MTWVYNAFNEVLPILSFFVFQQWHSFNAGLVALIVCMLLLLAASLLQRRSVPRFALASTVLVLLFAVPSILSGDRTYFQVSDTILDGIFAFILIGSWKFHYPILKILFGKVFAITDEGWRILSLRWGVLFLVLAVLNEYVRLTTSEDTWVHFKLYSTIFIVLFGCYQFTLSSRMRIPGESNQLGLRI